MANLHGTMQLVLSIIMIVGTCSLGTTSGTASRFQEHSLLATWEKASKKTPIERVVELLQEMKAQLDKEAQNDSESYDKMVCWCETNEKEKKAAIEEADAKIEDLFAEIEGLSAKLGSFSANIAQMKEDIATKQMALDTATSIREKEHAAFNTEENDMVQSITMLKNAIEVLKKHQAGLLQMTPAIQESMVAAMRWVTLKREEMLALGSDDLAAKHPAASLLQSTHGLDLGIADAVFKALRGSKSSALVEIPPSFSSRILAAAAKQGKSFLQLEPDYFDAKPAHLQAYVPQSSQIFGILSQMKEEFEANLSQSQKDELKAAEDFAELKASSEKEIAANKKALDEMEEENADDTKRLSDAKEDYEATREQRAADVKFLSDVRLQCQELDRQWEERSKSRAVEIKAVAGAIEILTADDARDIFMKKMGPGNGVSFLQLRASGLAQRAARSRAARVLMQAANQIARQLPDVADLYKVWHDSEEKPSQQLAAVAVQVQLDAFTKIKKVMDDMIADLKTQQEEEVKHKAMCNTELFENEKDTYTSNEELSDTKDKIQALEETIQKLKEEIESAKEQIKTIQVDTKEASLIREKENQDFQEEVNDQRAMQAILKKAIERMRVAYKKEALMQEDPVSPVQFQPYKQNAGGSPVIGMMEQIVEDSVKVADEAIAAENEAQKTYETFVNDSNSSIKSLQQAIETKTDAISASELDLQNEQTHASSVEEHLEDLAQLAADLHEECDFILKNFNIRQKARLQEIEAIQKAKAYLSGMRDDA